jgi:hypothetical protein|tara:strand:+ start:648 stop:869 length:222 start_codon:yes stop_codon:yes gene_type:complete
MKITKIFLACGIAISMSACAELPIISGGASFSGKDAIRTVNVIRNATKITMPGVHEEMSNGIKNVFGYHKNVH